MAIQSWDAYAHDLWFKNRVLLLQPDDYVHTDLKHLRLSGTMTRPGDETGSVALNTTSSLISS